MSWKYGSIVYRKVMLDLRYQRITWVGFPPTDSGILGIWGP